MIIAQKQVLVNPKKYTKWNAKKELNQLMSERMNQAGYIDRARRMSECADKIEITFCPECGHYEVSRAKLCRDRLCPVCSWRLSVKRYAEMSAVCSALLTDYPHNRWSFMTLTVQNCAPEQLDYTLAQMAQAFNRMRQRKVFKENVCGWARTVEVTFNAATNTLHPHYHILIMWNIGSEVVESGARLLNNWLASCRDLLVSYKGQHIEEITGSHDEQAPEDITGAVLETFKYTQKTSDLLSMPLRVFRDYARHMARKRAVAYGGLIKEYMKKLHFRTDDEPGDAEEVTICKNCGNADLSRALYKWSFAERSYLFDIEQAFD